MKPIRHVCVTSKFVDLTDRLHGLPHIGNLDIDLICSSDGSVYLIDVNPRFGGGYSFLITMVQIFLFFFLRIWCCLRPESIF